MFMRWRSRRATQIVLGYLIGARRLNDIQKRVNATLKVAIAACVGMAVLMCLGGKYIFLIFTDNPEIIGAWTADSGD